LIEIVSAETGEKVLRFQGRLLASRFDPRREAREWIASRKKFLGKVRSVFVLGLGSGHHIGELLEATQAKIVVLEASADILQASFDLKAFDSGRVSLHHISSARNLRKIEEVKAAVTQSFIVMTHAPSFSLFPEIYKDCQTQLIARDWGNLNWQWKLRGAADFDRTPRIDGTGETLSLHDIEQTELVQNSEEREKILFKALRELIK
jgi:hypothetical protein